MRFLMDTNPADGESMWLIPIQGCCEIGDGFLSTEFDYLKSINEKRRRAIADVNDGQSPMLTMRRNKSLGYILITYSIISVHEIK